MFTMYLLECNRYSGTFPQHKAVTGDKPDFVSKITHFKKRVEIPFSPGVLGAVFSTLLYGIIRCEEEYGHES